MSSGRASRAKLLGSLLLAAAIFAFLFRRVDVARVRAEIQEMTWLELATVALIAGWNQVTYWLLWMAVTPELGWAQAMTLTQAGTAVTNTVPGGSGIGVGLAYAMLDSWGSRGPAAPWPCSSPGCGTPSSSSPCPCSPWP